MEESEKVRIYHYDQFHRCNNKKKISTLKTEEGIIEGHNKVAEFLKNEVEALFGKEVKLDEEAQEKLLANKMHSSLKTFVGSRCFSRTGK